MTTLDQSDLSAVPDALRAGDGDDFIRDLARLVLQELVEAEAAVPHRFRSTSSSYQVSLDPLQTGN